MPTAATSETKVNKLDLWPYEPRNAKLAAVALWLIPMLVIGVMVSLRPTHRTVTIDCYHYATKQWWSGQSLYVGPAGMNYLPHFAVLFTPFHALPLWLGEVLWRVLAALALAGGLWRLIRIGFCAAPERPFLWASVACMPLCLNALRNGNANALFSGVMLLTIVAILESRWWLAAGLIALLTAIKPLGIVVMLLAPIVYSRLRSRSLVALLCMAVFPFLFGRTEYVWSQYREAWTNLQACAVVNQHRFADINGLFRTFGTPLSPGTSKLVRVLAGGITAGLWWLGARRLRGQEPLSALILYALATGYLMLFNPMNEVNSFAILAPALGAWAAWFLFRPELGAARPAGWTLLAMALSMGLLPELLRPVFHNYFALFWHPLMTFVFLVLLARFVWHTAPRTGDPARVQSPAPAARCESGQM